MSPTIIPSAGTLPFPASGRAEKNAGKFALPAAGTLAELASRRIFFAHQSVGNDILAGVRERLETEGVSLPICSSAESSGRGGMFLHSFLGHNGDPTGKLADFAGHLALLGNDLEVAVFMFCSPDVMTGTEVGALFAAYRKTMEGIDRRYPQLRLVHCTVPLTRRQTGPKSCLKRLLGLPVVGVEDNLTRQRFNDLLRRTYGWEVFDLAAAESTWPDGRREIIFHHGEAGYALVPAYSDDDGQLNTLGRQVVADRFLAYLSKLD